MMQSHHHCRYLKGVVLFTALTTYDVQAQWMQALPCQGGHEQRALPSLPGSDDGTVCPKLARQYLYAEHGGPAFGGAAAIPSRAEGGAGQSAGGGGAETGQKAKLARKKAAEVEQQVLKHDEEARAKAKEGASLAARAPAEQRQRKTQQPASTRCGRLRVESHKFGRRHPDLVLRIFLSVGTWVLILTR